MDVINPAPNLQTLDLIALEEQKQFLIYQSVIENLFHFFKNSTQQPIDSPEFVEQIQQLLHGHHIKVTEAELVDFFDELNDSIDLEEVETQKSFDPKGILVSGELHPHLASRIEKLLQQAHEEGLNVFLFEGYRSFQKQNKLYNSGRGVTRARAGNSYHNYGLAADIIFYDKKGHPSWSSHHDWMRIGEIGKSLGLKWGGDFKKIKDFTHFEYHPDMNLKDVKRIYQNQGIKGVWHAVGD